MDRMIYALSAAMCALIAAVVVYVWVIADASTPMAPLRTIMYWCVGTLVLVRVWYRARQQDVFLLRTHHHVHGTTACYLTGAEYYTWVPPTTMYDWEDDSQYGSPF